MEQSTVDPRLDHELVQALRRGDEEAFRELVCSHDGGLQRMARLYVDEALVEDVVQETWIAVVDGIAEFEGRARLRTWIYGILVNIARRRALRERRCLPFAVATAASDSGGVDLERLHHPELGHGYWPAPPTWSRDPESDALAGEVREVILLTLGQLPGGQRTVMTLRDLEGWPAADVCDLLRISDVNQRTLLHRARIAVRGALEEYLNG